MTRQFAGRILLALTGALVLCTLGLQQVAAQERPQVQAEPVYSKYSAAPESVLANSFSSKPEILQEICALDKLSPELMARLKKRPDFDEIIAQTLEQCPDVVGTTVTSRTIEHCDPGDPNGGCYVPPQTQCDPTDANGGCYVPPETCDPTDANGGCYVPPETCDPTDANGGCYVPPCEADNSCTPEVHTLRYGISYVMYTLADGTTVKIEGWNGDVKDPTDGEKYVSEIQTLYGQDVTGYVIKAGTHYYDQYGNEVDPIANQSDFEYTASQFESLYGSGTTITTTTTLSVTTVTSTAPKKSSGGKALGKTKTTTTTVGSSSTRSGGKSSHSSSGKSSTGSSGGSSRSSHSSSSHGSSGGSHGSSGSDHGQSGSSHGGGRKN